MMNNTEKRMLGIYIHIPFCRSKCFYCDFCSYADSDKEKKEEYVRHLISSIVAFSPRAKEYTVDTVYIGGGTPTCLDADVLGNILNTVKCKYKLSSDAEISVECNPATADRHYFEILKMYGFNRLSIGAQSTDDKELQGLGRIHSAADFKKCFWDAREAGFKNISVDVMYGIPGQTVQSFAKTLEDIIDLGPEHISAYGLKVEDGTPFAKMKKSKEIVLPDEDTEYNMYCMACKILGKAGYSHYEISNYARGEARSKHNMRYWTGADYIGFGSAAYSFFEGKRFHNGRGLDASCINLFEEDADKEMSAADEYLMLSLRLYDGIDFEEYKRLSGNDKLQKSSKILRDMESGGYIEYTSGGFRLTEKGFYVSNYIITELFL